MNIIELHNGLPLATNEFTFNGKKIKYIFRHKTYVIDYFYNKVSEGMDCRLCFSYLWKLHNLSDSYGEPILMPLFFINLLGLHENLEYYKMLNILTTSIVMAPITGIYIITSRMDNLPNLKLTINSIDDHFIRQVSPENRSDDNLTYDEEIKIIQAVYNYIISGSFEKMIYYSFSDLIKTVYLINILKIKYSSNISIISSIEWFSFTIDSLVSTFGGILNFNKIRMNQKNEFLIRHLFNVKIITEDPFESIYLAIQNINTYLLDMLA